MTEEIVEEERFYYLEADPTWDKEYHPDFCDEDCPDYMESGKFCGTAGVTA